MKQGEMHKAMEYATKFKQHKNLLEDLNKESTSIIYGGQKPKYNLLFL